jgi:hypothetical protein
MPSRQQHAQIVRVGKPFCSTDDPDAATAFALYAGSSVEELDGTEFIVDQSGSLRTTGTAVDVSSLLDRRFLPPGIPAKS